MNLFRNILYTFVLLGSGFCLLVHPLQAGPLQAEAAQSPESEVQVPYINLFPEAVAKVNDGIVSGWELENDIRNELAPIGSPKWTDLREEYRGQLVYSALMALVNSKLLYEEAVSVGTKVTDAEVQDEFLKMTQMFEGDAQVDAYLKSRNMDRTSAIQEIQKGLVINKFIDETIRNGILVSPEEMEQYYSAHTDEFKHPDIVRTSQILIEEGNTPSSIAKAKMQVDSIMERIRKGENFAALAREYSKGPSAALGGDLGFSAKNALSDEYGEAAFSLPIGGTKLIRTQQGYRIIKVTDRKDEGTATLEESQEPLTKFLKNEKAQAEITKMINRLRDKSEIELLIPAGVQLQP